MNLKRGTVKGILSVAAVAALLQPWSPIARPTTHSAPVI